MQSFRLMRVASLVILGLVLAFGSFTAFAAAANGKDDLRSFIEEHFQRWDTSRGGSLTQAEIDRLIISPSVNGREATVIVAISRQMKKGDRTKLDLNDLLGLAQDRSFLESVDRGFTKLDSIDRTLFAADDPNLDSFRQGRLSDCYLLSPIAAMVHRNPQAVRDMISQKDEGFNVVFGGGKRVHVPRVTDCELLLGVRLDGKQGIWLAVLEKAYGIIRERDASDKHHTPGDVVAHDALNQGRAGPIISLLTGHDTEKVPLRTASVQKVHDALTMAMRRKWLTCCKTPEGQKMAPGLTVDHFYAVLGYDADRRRVKVFNPHGNTFEPRGEPGISNGYRTTAGVFIVPLDDFTKIFSSITHEDAREPKKSGNSHQNHHKRK